MFYDVSLTESTNYFGSLEGVIKSHFFGCNINAVAKKCGESYARKCAEYLDALPAELLDTLQRASKAYLIDLMYEHEDEYELPEDFSFDEDSPAADIMEWLSPEMIVFESGILSDDDAPPAFSLKMMFTPVPDEYIEWVVRNDTAVYVGEYNDISPWNEKIQKKKWNYINAV